jgi:hypothetical protein
VHTQSLRTAVAVSIAATTVCLQPVARAAGEAESRSEISSGEQAPSRIEWGARVNAGIGVGHVATDTSLLSGLSWRAGLDGEYWWSRYVGFGFQLGLETAGHTPALFGSSATHTATTDSFSLGPTVLLRGANPRTFPVLGVGVGYARGSYAWSSYCPDYLAQAGQCSGSSSGTRDDSGPYGSLMAVWLFHPGTHGPGLALGPLVRFDAFYALGSNAGTTWSMTAGMEIGFGFGRKPAQKSGTGGGPP